MGALGTNGAIDHVMSAERARARQKQPALPPSRALPRRTHTGFVRRSASPWPSSAGSDRRVPGSATDGEQRDLREIGRASCRERGWQYGSISVVDGALKKKTTKKT